MRTVFIAALVLGVCARAAAHPREDREAQYYADAYAKHYGVPKALVHAVIAQESAWNSRAVSSAGAQGLMQLMPGTARRFGTSSPFDKSQNIAGGVRYLRQLMDQFQGDLRLALAAYYAGEAHVARRGLRYNNHDVVTYVEQVRRRYLDELSSRKERGRSRP